MQRFWRAVANQVLNFQLSISQFSSLILCSGYRQTDYGCYKDVQTFLRDLDPDDYFQDEDEEKVSNKVKKQ